MNLDMLLTHSLFKSLSDRVDQGVREHGVPSLVAGVVEKGELVWSHAVGHSNIEKQRPADTTTPYSVASITKPVMGTLLAILNERGKLDMHRPANWYFERPLLTAYEGSAESATIARLANHTSGLPVHYQFFSASDDVQPPAFTETLSRYGNLVDPPGERYTYSNLGYGALGWIAERVSEKALRDLMHEEVLGPLEMQNSFFSPTSAELEGCAIRYEAGRLPLPHYVTDHPAASELFASLEDLLQFGAWHLGWEVDPVLSPVGKRKMQAPLESSAAAQGYGLGWGLGSTTKGEKLVSHSGGMAGVSTRLVLCPERQLVIAVMANAATELVNEVVTGINAIMRFNPPGPSHHVKVPVFAPEPLVGSWKGLIHAYDGDYDLRIDLGADSEEVVICDEPAGSAFIYGEDHLYGPVEAELDTSDSRRTPHALVMNLRLRGKRLSGVTTAESLADVTLRNALSYPTWLERV